MQMVAPTSRAILYRYSLQDPSNQTVPVGRDPQSRSRSVRCRHRCCCLIPNASGSLAVHLHEIASSRSARTNKSSNCPSSSSAHFTPDQDLGRIKKFKKIKSFNLPFIFIFPRTTFPSRRSVPVCRPRVNCERLTDPGHNQHYSHYFLL